MILPVLYSIQGRDIPSQDIGVITQTDLDFAKRTYLPILMNLWIAVESSTGYRWKCTSFIRDSPSHMSGSAIDLAPDIDPNSSKLYAVTNNSDPVLYKREKLVRALQSAVASLPNFSYSTGIYIEPDHLHIAVFTPEINGTTHNVLVKWGIIKEVYPDSHVRSQLPLIQ